jgi:hypothetical protein
MGWAEDRRAAAGLLRLVRKKPPHNNMTPWDTVLFAARVAFKEDKPRVFTVLRETATHFNPPATVKIEQRYPWR